jgi:anti-sigma regulatory factor (Ser/Thr protein kinase)
VLDTVYPAVPNSVAAARANVAAVAQAAGASEGSIDSIRLAVSEAVTNAVQHAYRGRDGDVRVTATMLLGQLLVVVTDEGCGLIPHPEGAGLGCGLMLIEAHSDRRTLATPPGGGVQLEMRFSLN